MPDYSKGKIYKLICDDPELIYIGSTTQHYLANRLSGHHQSYKKGMDVSSHKLFEAGGVKIELIELYPCECKEQLLLRERYWLEHTECVNVIKRPFVTYEENLERVKKYAQDNREEVLRKKREYTARTKEKKREYDRLNYQKNRERKLNQVQEYYANNRDKRIEYASSYYYMNKNNQ